MRREFLEEWREAQRMEMEAMGAQAAEEAREERRQEEQALIENRQELERMAEKRYSSCVLFSALILGYNNSGGAEEKTTTSKGPMHSNDHIKETWLTIEGGRVPPPTPLGVIYAVKG